MIDGRWTWPLQEQTLCRYITKCVHLIGMNLLFGPVSVKVNGGSQAHAIIAESHMMVEARAGGELFIDVFSCKPFDTSIPSALAAEDIGLGSNYVVRIIHRAGTEPPETG